MSHTCTTRRQLEFAQSDVLQLLLGILHVRVQRRHGNHNLTGLAADMFLDK